VTALAKWIAAQNAPGGEAKGLEKIIFAKGLPAIFAATGFKPANAGQNGRNHFLIKVYDADEQ